MQSDSSKINLAIIVVEACGFHFDLKTKPNGSGTVTLKFSDEAEFNDIFEYLVQR